MPVMHTRIGAAIEEAGPTPHMCMPGILLGCLPEVLEVEKPGADPPEVAVGGAGAWLAISFSIHSCCLGENGVLPAPLLDPGRDDRC